MISGPEANVPPHPAQGPNPRLMISWTSRIQGRRRIRRSIVHNRAADISRAVSRLLKVFGDIILPRLNENCIVVGFAVIASQSLANLIPSAGGNAAPGGISLWGAREWKEEKDAVSVVQEMFAKEPLLDDVLIPAIVNRDTANKAVWKRVRYSSKYSKILWNTVKYYEMKTYIRTLVSRNPWLSRQGWVRLCELAYKVITE